MDFFIVGAAKSGTTILYEWLKQQSGIFLPEVKEPHYYAFNGSGPEEIGKGVDPAYAQQIAYSERSYASLYADAGSGQLKGDVSPGYLYFPNASEAIQADHPRAKIIVVLRNPVERAFSQYMHHRRDGYEPIATFEHALDVESERMEQGWWWGYHYTNASLYANALERYYSTFPAANILTLTYDDLESNPQKTFEKVMQFLDCKIDSQIDFDRRTNVSSSLAKVPRFSWLHRGVEAGGPLHRMVRAIMPKGMVRLLRNSITALNKAPADHLNDVLRERLEAAFYPDILRCSRITTRDLSAWLTTAPSQN